MVAVVIGTVALRVVLEVAVTEALLVALARLTQVVAVVVVQEVLLLGVVLAAQVALVLLYLKPARNTRLPSQGV